MRYGKQLDLGRGRSVKLPRQDSGFFTDARQSGSVAVAHMRIDLLK